MNDDRWLWSSRDIVRVSNAPTLPRLGQWHQVTFSRFTSALAFPVTIVTMHIQRQVGLDDPSLYIIKLSCISAPRSL